ncbi:hypothetical protein BLNAU_9082 [Blattamonas nauphoetae]|uniref:Protein kinase domain-containing protein n=1 Tax=Blattamonas nauphoetae TaxID=2049346 RepID=A0ABQ9XWQ0_9EUKA|nr:hypothetical protein BLNAU_9082 [Blattamonas nauphoetae]
MSTLLFLFLLASVHPYQQLSVDLATFLIPDSCSNEGASSSQTFTLNHAYSALNLTLSGTSLTLIGNGHETALFSDHSDSDFDYLLLLVNTTISCQTVSFCGNCHIASVDELSAFISSQCEIHVDCDKAALLVWGSATILSTTFKCPPTARNAPLITSPGGSGTVSVDGCTFSSSFIDQSASLLGRSYSSMSASNCHFHNISTSSIASPSKEVPVRPTTLVCGSSFSFVSNGLYGTIVRDINADGDFLASNLTVSSNHAHNEAGYTTISQNQHFSSTNTVQDCLFNGCSTNVRGGGLSFSRSGDFGVIHCKFVDCHATSSTGSHGGAFSYYTGEITEASTLNMDGCIIIDCSSSFVAGGFFIGAWTDRSEYVDATIKGVDITGCNSTSHSGGLLLQFLNHTTITNVKLSNCRSPITDLITINGVWSALSLSSVDATTSKEPSQRALYFRFTFGQVKCESFRIISNANYSNGMIIVNDVWDDVSFPEAPKGNTISLYPLPTFSDIIIERGEDSTVGPTFAFNSQWDPKFIGTFNPRTIFHTPSTSLTTASQPTVYANSQNQRKWVEGSKITLNRDDGKEEAFCWLPPSKCLSLGDLIPRTGSAFEGTIVLEAGEFGEKDVNLRERVLDMSGVSTSETLLKDEGSTIALLRVAAGGDLSLSQLTIHAGASVPVLSSSGQVTLSTVLFVSPQQRTASLIEGKGGKIAATELTIADISFSSGNVLDLTNTELDMKSTTFSEISNAGACSVIRCTSSKSVSLSNVIFVNIVSSSSAHALFFDATSLTEAPSLKLLSVSFSHSESSTMSTRNENSISEVMVVGKDLGSWINAANWEGSFSASLETALWGEDTENGISSSLLVYLVEIGDEVLVGGEQSASITDCGHFGVGCVTMSEGWERVRTRSTSPQIVIGSSMGMESLSFDGDKIVALSGTGLPTPTLAASGSTSLSIAAGSLTISSIEFSVNSALTTPLFVVRGGSLTLESSVSVGSSVTSAHQNCLLSISSGSATLNNPTIPFTPGATFASTSLIEQSGGVLIVTGSTFSNIVKNEGHGSVISSTLKQSSDKIEIVDCSFSSCSCLNGNGGAIWISCISSVPSTGVIVSASFSDCACSSTGLGEWVFVEGYTFTSLLVPSSWSITPQLKNPADIANLWGTDLNELAESNYRSVSLLLYLTQYEATTVEIWSSGRDLAGCGSSQWRCSQIAVASSHLAGVGLHTLSIADSVSLSDQLSFSTNDFTLSSPSPTTTISVSSTATISISGHTLTLSSLLFDGLSQARTTAFISLASTGAVSVSSCTFTKFTRSSGNGAVFSVSLSSSNSLNLNTVSFSKCESEKGGPLFVDVSDSTAAGQVTFVGVTFGTGSDKNVGTSGNNLYLKCSSMSSASETGIASLSPTLPATKDATDDILNDFVGIDSSNTELSLLLIWNAHTNGDVNVMTSGHSHANCGIVQLPCSSLERGHLNVKSSGNTVVIADDQTLSTTLAVPNFEETITSDIGMRKVIVQSAGSISVASGKLNLVKMEFKSEANIKLTTSLLVVSSGSLNVTSCSFKTISSSADGSCISATLSTNSLSIADTAFKTCSSDGSGGAVFVSCGSTVMASQLSVKASFEKCSCGASGSGKWVFVEGYALASLLVESSWSIAPQLSNPTDIANLWGTDLNELAESNYHSVSLLLYLTQYEATTVEMGSSGRDLAGCGLSPWGCSQFDVTLSHLAGVGLHTLSVVDSVFLSDQLSFSTNDITLSSPSSTTTISVSSTATISISGHTLTLSSLLFDGLSQARTTAFISLASTGAVYVSSCSFTKFTRSSGNGAVFSVSLSASNSLNLNTVRFSKCESENGGPLFVDVSDSTAAGQVTFVGVTFGTGSDKNVGTAGNNLYLKCSSMSSASETGIASLSPTLPATKEATDLILNDFVGIDSSSTELSLLLIWNAHSSGDVNVMTSGHSHANCGIVQLPCSSLAQGHLQVKPSGSTVVIADNQILSTTLTFPNFEETITSDVGVRAVTVESAGSIILNQPESTLCLLNLLFVMDSTSSTLTQSLVSVNGGSLSLRSCTLDSFSVKQISLISLSAGSLNVTDCNVTGIVGSSDTSSSSNGVGRTLTLDIESDEIASFGAESLPVTFKDCSSDGDGGVISACVKGTGVLSLHNTRFVSCVSSGRGGALFVACASEVKSSQLSIDSTFEACSCGDSLKGEWVFVQGRYFPELIEASSWSTSFAGLSIESDSPKLWGEDSAEDVDSEFFSITLLYYLLPYRSHQIYVGSIGRNSNGCGSSTHHCQSLVLAHDHLIDDEQVIKINGSCSLDAVLAFDNDDVTIKPSVGRGVIGMAGGGQFVNSDAPLGNVIEFHRIDFDLSELAGHPMIQSTVGEVILQHCSFISSSSFQVTLLEASKGQVALTNLTMDSMSFGVTPFVFTDLASFSFTNVSVTNCSMSAFVTSTNTQSTHSTGKFTDCEFEGTGTAHNSEGAEPKCEWSTGLIRQTNTTTTFHSTHFTNLAEGAIWMSGGRVRIESSLFHDNGEIPLLFPSFGQNIRCSAAGVVDVESLLGGEGADGTAAWISGDDCTIVSKVVDPLAPLFVPSIDVNTTLVSFDKKTKVYSLSVNGTVLIPCGLSLEISESGSSSNSSNWTLPLSPSTCTSLTETFITLDMKESELLTNLSSKGEWKGCLVFGRNQRTDSFRVKDKQSALALSAMKKALRWIIPLVVGVLALIIILLIIICVCRRRQKQKGEEMQQLTENAELAPMDLEKIDILDEHPSIGAIRNNSAEGNDVLVKTEAETITKKHLPSSTAPDSRPCVEAIHCEDPFDTTAVRRMDSLFNILHRQDAPLQFDRRRLQRAVVEALKQLGAKEPKSELLTKLNPHNVMVEKEGTVSLTLNEDDAKTDGQTHTDQSGFRPGGSDRTGKRHAGMRWEAPEVAKAREMHAEGGNGESKKEVDRIQASLFSLGLVLWEIETGSVPFGEMDAVNAARQLETGILPNMVWVTDATLRETLISCLSLTPSDRPSCDQILSVFDGLAGPQRINVEARQKQESVKNEPFAA